jgi:hypothetical protein
VISTPHKPAIDANAMFDHRARAERLPHRPSEQHVGDLAAARFTVDMITMLKKRPEIDGAERAHQRGGLAE